VLHLNAIAVVDPEQEKVVWAHTGEYGTSERLPNGNTLVSEVPLLQGTQARSQYEPPEKLLGQ
jgi:hypothetical protein